MFSTETIKCTVPPKDGLCCMIYKIDNEKDKKTNPENDQYDKYLKNLFKCRQFLRETPQAMAAPITHGKLFELGRSLYVIVAKDFLENDTKNFQDHCNALCIEETDSLDLLDYDVYKKCLEYTMICRLAPHWNKIEQDLQLYLVEGRDFLSSTRSVDGKLNAIMFNIYNIRDNSAKFHVKAVNLEIPFLRLNKSQPASIHVLPKMTMTQEWKKFEEIPKERKNLFKDYEDLRAYWENMHGYILPDHEEGLLYYDVTFFNGFTLLYPETCLTSGPLRKLYTMDPKSTIYDKFEEDLKTRVTELCGHRINPSRVLKWEPTMFLIDRKRKNNRSSIRDTGCGTQSSSFSNEMSSRTSDSFNIPIKQSRSSLPGINNSLICETEVDVGIGSTCSTSNVVKFPKTIDNIATISCDADSATTSNPIVQKNEEKSHYFKQKEAKPENKALVQELMDKKEKPEHKS